MRSIRILGLAVLLCAAPAWAADSITYLALVDGGKQAGRQIVRHGDDGTTRVDFVFKDNGRGPELKEEYALADDGTFRRYAIRGTSTFGAPVEESFNRDGDAAQWKSLSDAGSRSVSGTAHYWSLAGTPQAFSVAIAALSRRADGKLPLIPGGTLTMREVAEAEVAGAGGRRRVQLLALTGVGLNPAFVWATDDATPRLFAFIIPGYVQLIEDGWQANGDALETRQKAAEGEALADLQRRLAHPLRGTTLIRNARVFDSRQAVLGAAGDVLLRDGRIVAVGGAGEGRDAPDHVLDAGGRVLLPGLFDMHGHVFNRWSGGLDIAAGVTTTRDMGNDNATLQELIADEQAGRALLPRIVPAGFIEGESAQSARNGFVIKDLAGAKQAIDWYASKGYPQIKIYNSFPRQHLRATVAYAHEKGLRVSGHVPVFVRAQDVVDAGFDEIQHINQVLLNFLVKPDTDTRTLERFYLPAKGIADLDFDAEPVQDFIALLAKKQVVIDPTLATFDFIRQRAGELSPVYAAVAEHMPPDVQRGFRFAEFDIPDDASAARYEKSYAKMIEFVGRLHAAGVPIVAGTDALPGFTLQRELELYVQAGLTPPQVLQIATATAAKYARVAEDRGAIAPGMRADLILVDGDPTTDIADIRRVATVIKGDTVYYPAEVHAALGIKPFAEPVRVRAAR